MAKANLGSACVTGFFGAMLLFGQGCDGEQLAAGACNVHEDCATSEICVDGTCRTICNASQDCPSKVEACDDGVCVVNPDPECEADEDCQAVSPPLCHTLPSATCYGGECEFLNMAAGAACLTGNPCMQDEQCDGDGNCVGTPVVCDDPPADFCNEEDTEYHDFSDTGTCESSTGECVYPEDVSACPSCSQDCLEQCSGISCPDAEGGCMQQGHCLADPTAGPQCVYDNMALDDTACVRDVDGDGVARGVCVTGACHDCNTDASACARYPTSYEQCFQTRCEMNNCYYDVLSDVVCQEAGCAEAVVDVQRTCGSDGSCPAVAPTPCAPFTCDAAGLACLSDCSSDSQCVGGYTCYAGNCIALDLLGDSCTDEGVPGDCELGFQCGAGVCCLDDEDACCTQAGDCDINHECNTDMVACRPSCAKYEVFELGDAGTFCTGGTTQFALSGSQVGVRYRLRRDGVVVGGSELEGTGSSLTFAVGLAGTYAVEAFNGTECTAAMSGETTIEAAAAPVITADPQSTTVCPGSSPVFEVTATGYALEYQWERNTGSGWTTIAGATGDALTVMSPSYAMSGEQYRCVVSDGCGSSSTSAPAAMTVRECCTNGDCVGADPNDCLACNGSYQCAVASWQTEPAVTIGDCSASQVTCTTSTTSSGSMAFASDGTYSTTISLALGTSYRKIRFSGTASAYTNYGDRAEMTLYDDSTAVLQAACSDAPSCSATDSVSNYITVDVPAGATGDFELVFGVSVMGDTGGGSFTYDFDGCLK